MLNVLDETQKLMRYSKELEVKSAELEEAGTQLQEANNRLKEIDKVKDEFLTTITHELRTPITSIKSLSHILHDNKDLEPKKKEEFLQIIVKESDRIAATVALLESNGVSVEEREAGMTVTGLGYGPANDCPTLPGGGHVVTHHDHRIAMSALILGLMSDKAVTIDDASMIATSFPTFFEQMASLGASTLVKAG